MLTDQQIQGLVKPTAEARCSICEWVGVAARWVLGALFIYMGVNKAINPVDFLKLVKQYEMITNPYLLNSIAAALPWFEVFCGLLLVLGIAVRSSAFMLVLMLIPFSIVVTLRALGISATEGLPFCSVKFDCGCGSGEVYICRKLVENACLLLGSCWLVLGKGRPLSIRFTL